MTEQVPSWQVTITMLESWGFPVEKRDKCVGMQMVERPGMPFGKALHAAWAAGFVRIAAIPEAVAAQGRAESRARMAEQHRCAEETVAALQAAGLIHRRAV